MNAHSTHDKLVTVALDCLRDLGVTLVYAAIAGLLIVLIVASDNGPISFLKAGCYAAVLPSAVLVLIAVEVGLSVLGEWRTKRRQPAR